MKLYCTKKKKGFICVNNSLESGTDELVEDKVVSYQRFFDVLMSKLTEKGTIRDIKRMDADRYAVYYYDEKQKKDCTASIEFSMELIRDKRFKYMLKNLLSTLESQREDIAKKFYCRETVEKYPKALVNNLLLTLDHQYTLTTENEAMAFTKFLNEQRDKYYPFFVSELEKRRSMPKVLAGVSSVVLPIASTAALYMNLPISFSYAPAVFGSIAAGIVLPQFAYHLYLNNQYLKYSKKIGAKYGIKYDYIDQKVEVEKDERLEKRFEKDYYYQGLSRLLDYTYNAIHSDLTSERILIIAELKSYLESARTFEPVDKYVKVANLLALRSAVFSKICEQDKKEVPYNLSYDEDLSLATEYLAIKDREYKNDEKVSKMAKYAEVLFGENYKEKDNDLNKLEIATLTHIYTNCLKLPSKYNGTIEELGSEFNGDVTKLSYGRS